VSASIILKNLRVPAKIGVYPHEKEGSQTLKLDLQLTLGKTSASLTDRLRDTVDYDVLIRYIKQFAQSEHFELLERFTYALAAELLRDFPLQACELTAWKHIAAHAPTEIAVRVTMQAGADWPEMHRVDEDDRFND
jgi:7,8-dihydroneopterin aldolase/epimerase/oxygenase